ncbi:GNAT family N-acetyltransferase, partial [Klebsiella pneumoniae]|nr:GNAT family N-acetyltransferase [Klebsiella pneumoniae]
IATAADAEDLAATHAAAFRRGWGADEFERLPGDRTAEAHVVCREPNGPVVGFVLSHVVPPDSEILSIAVLPEARGRGHGRTLL